MKLMSVISWLRIAAMAMSAVMAACATPVSGVVKPVGASTQRLLVRTVADWPVVDVLARRVVEVTGVSVADVSLVAPRQFALSLLCRDAITCRAARERLSAEPNFLLGVLDDQRKHLPTRPEPSVSP